MPILQIENPGRGPGKGGNVAKKRGKLTGAAKAAFLARMAKGRKSSARRPSAAKSPNRKTRRSSKRAAVTAVMAATKLRRPKRAVKRRAWNKGKHFTHVKPIGSYERKPKVAAHQRHVNPQEGGTMTRRRKRRKTAKKRKTTATASARTSPRRRRNPSRRRKTAHRRVYRRRSNPNDTVAQIGTVVAGGGLGIGAGYLADSYGARFIANPLYRAGALILAGLGIGSLVGRKRPDLGVAMGVGIAGAGMTRGAAKYLPQLTASTSASAPKQLSGVYDNMMGEVTSQPYVREQRASASGFENLSY